MSDLLAEIASREKARLEAKSKPYARTGPIASDIDPDGCLRRQVLEIVRWEDKPLFEAHTQARFEVGNLHENEAIIHLKQAGFVVIEEQVPFELKRRGGSGEPCLRGKLDGKVLWEGEKIPFEVKSMHPNVFAATKGVEDLLRWWWTKKYLSQLQAYLVGYGEASWGFFMLTDCLGHWKLLRVDLDLAEAERIWAFAEEIADAVALARLVAPALPGTDIAPYTSKPTECTHCDFFGRTCQPDLVQQGAAFMSDPDLLSSLERREKLKAAAHEYEALDKNVKTAIKVSGVERAVAGSFMIEVSKAPRVGYAVKPSVTTTIKIERVGQSTEGE